MKRMLPPVAAALSLLLHPVAGTAQERTGGWQRQEATPPPVSVFHSTQSANLPTAETLERGSWLFEISHRFQPPVSGGADALWGLDGPVVNRLALAWNTELPDLDGLEDNESQAYAQLIPDVGLAPQLAVGLVPTLVRNPRVADAGASTSLALGLHGQWYVADGTSLFAEWLVARGRDDLEHDAGTLGVELETGGHFFKLVATNSTRMSPTQFLGGTPHPFELDQWRLGFNVTRLLLF